MNESAPVRTCVGCRERFPQHALVRCVLGPDGPMVHRTAAGRGAWLCSGECLETAIRRRAFDRAWRRTVSSDELAALRIVFNGVITEVEESPDGRTSSSGRGR